MSPLSSVLMMSSYIFCELISCFKVHMPPFFVECPPSNGVAFLLARASVVVSWDIGESILSGD